MDKDWVLLDSYSDSSKAHLVRALLDEHEIPTMILNKKDSAYGIFGQLEIYVHRDQAVTAVYLINKHLKEN